MIKMCLLLTLLATLISSAAAQDVRVRPPLTVRENPQAAPTQPNTRPAMTTTSSDLPFCPKKTCLYYAGDFDSTDSNANGLYNANDTGVLGQVWVGVKPTKAAIVTGATFNQFFTAGFVGTNPTPFQTRIVWHRT
jgi:opacity protein-like surface antigen